MVEQLSPGSLIQNNPTKTENPKLKIREETPCVKGSSVNAKQTLWKLDEVDSAFAG